MPDSKAQIFEKRGEGVAATFEEDEPGDVALLKLARQIWFKIWLLLSLGLSLSEPILIAWGSETDFIQKIVLAASSGLFIIGYIAVMIAMPAGMSLPRRFWNALLPEVWIEIFSFAMGWGLIFQQPAFAVLRCFRVFRFVWYSEFYLAKKGSPFFPLTFLCHVVLQYLKKIGEELFTTSSKGAVVVLGFFFYMAYIMGVAFWQQTAYWTLLSAEGGPNGNVSECDTLPHCFLIMLRLTFWDGSGFDYLKSVMDYGTPMSKGMTALLILYMCFSAMVLLNGLIGIFSAAFQAATKDDDDDDDKDSDEKGSDDDEKGGDDKKKEEKEDFDEEEKKDDKKKKKKKKEKEVEMAEMNPESILKTLKSVEQLCKKLEADIADIKSKMRVAPAIGE